MRGDGLQDRRAAADGARPACRSCPAPTSRSTTAEEALAHRASEIGYPVALKAAAGGGGKGIEVVRAPRTSCERGLESARREGAAVLRATPPCTSSVPATTRGTSRCRCWPTRTGTVVHLGERDCSIQRRHQKIVEETPSPAVDAGAARRDRARSACDAARAVGYVNAGTVEFLLDADGTFYFLEMNTRLQVEHTITEVVTGLDLVREQLRIAAGEPLSFAQDDVGSAATRSSAASTPRIRPAASCPRRG